MTPILNRSAAEAIAAVLRISLPNEGSFTLKSGKIAVVAGPRAISITHEAGPTERYGDWNDFSEAYGLHAPDAMDAAHPRNADTPKMLYALMRSVPGPYKTLNLVDWGRVDLTAEEVTTWWEATREFFDEQKATLALAAGARAKLTAQELRALGLKP